MNNSFYLTYPSIDDKQAWLEYTNEYIVTPSVSGVYIIDIGAIYQGKMINYYFMVQISKISGDEVNISIN